MSTSLSPTEAAELERLEAIITRGWRVFVEVGEALAKIHEGRLYRQTHDSFEAYCKDVWKWSRARAYQLMDAARTSQTLAEVGVTVETEREARRLKPVAVLVNTLAPQDRRPAAVQAIQATPRPAPAPAGQRLAGEKPDASMVLTRKGGLWGGYLYLKGMPGERIPATCETFEDAAAYVSQRLAESDQPEQVPA